MKRILSLVLLFATLFSVTPPSFYASVLEEQNDEVTNMNELPIDLRDVQQSNDIETSSSKIQSENPNLTIQGDVETGEMSLETSEGELKIDTTQSSNSETKIVDNTLVVEEDNSFVENKILDGGVQALYTMENELAPNEFIVNLDLEEGSSIQQNSETGEYYVQNAKGETTTLIGSPWATTKNGEFLKTHYEIVGNKIIQKIDTSSVQQQDYPVKADPLFCSDTVYDAKWDSKSEKGTLAVYTNGCARAYIQANFLFGAIGAFSTSAIASDIWNEVQGDYDYKKNISPGYKWRIYDQLMCHAINPATQLKYPWNLEKYRPDVSLWSTYLAGCNPKW
ncbi:MAG: DUF2599 domain-containing protein [Mycoplasmatales bacterium]